MPNTDPTMSSVLSAVRGLVIFAGGFLVAKGYVTNDQLVQIGAIVASIVSLGFGIYSQVKNKKDVKVALATPVPVGMNPIPNPKGS